MMRDLTSPRAILLMGRGTNLEKTEQTHVVIDGKEIRITKCPLAPIDADLHFDRFSHDDAGHAPAITRSTALAHKSFGEPLFADGRRTGSRKQAD